MNVDTALQRLWYEGRHRWLPVMLLPLAALFAAAASLRRTLYRIGLARSIRVERPVIVVGNITVGGTGKTPFVVWLAAELRARGWQPGIVLRGYGGRSQEWPREVTAETSAEEVGDEAVVLARRTGAIVIAGADRVAAARRAIERGADVVIADDGLQHYRLARDCEVAVVDAERRFGNGLPLPAGPLREPRTRLARVNLIVLTHRGGDRLESSQVARLSMQVPVVTARPLLGAAVSLRTGERRALASFRGQRVHAIAGIGNPRAFFAALAAVGLEVDGRALADHARLAREDLEFHDDAPVLMTEKDAIKCRAFADERHWAVGLDVQLGEQDTAQVTAVVDAAIRRRATIAG